MAQVQANTLDVDEAFHNSEITTLEEIVRVGFQSDRSRRPVQWGHSQGSWWGPCGPQLSHCGWRMANNIAVSYREWADMSQIVTESRIS